MVGKVTDMRITSLTMTIIAGMLGISFAPLARPVSIQFDFSTTAGSYTSGRIAPAYEATATEPNYNSTNTITNSGGTGTLNSGTNGTAWNALTGGTVISNGSNLKYVDGSFVPSGAITVTTAYGNGTTSGTVAAWQYGPADWGSVGSSTTGVQATTLMQDELYSLAGGGGTQVFGFRIQGLPVGSYQLFALGATPTAENRSKTIRMGVFTLSAQNDPNDAALFTAGTLGTGGVANAPAWVSGKNYLIGTVTTANASDYIVTMVTGANPALNGIEIVPLAPVPEPAMLSLLALGGLALLRRRK